MCYILAISVITGNICSIQKDELGELHKPILQCHCEKQMCAGTYIQTHYGQTECIFAMQEKGLLDILPSFQEVLPQMFRL